MVKPLLSRLLTASGVNRPTETRLAAAPTEVDANVVFVVVAVNHRQAKALAQSLNRSCSSNLGWGSN